MSKRKKITEQIAEDIRSKYASGEYTQGELADLFSVSVPTINKTVRGVAPPKRKYAHRTRRFQERNEEIVSLYNSGTPTREIAENFKMTHQNVSLILQAAGVSPQKRYFKRLQKQKDQRVAAEAAVKEQKKQAKLDKVKTLSALWIGGCTVKEFRDAAGLKSVGAAQVKVVNLRKKYPDLFPRRSRNHLTEEERAERDAKAEQLSKLWIAKASNEEMAQVFGWSPDAVTKQVPRLRKIYGTDMFPLRRKSKARKEQERLEKELEVIDPTVEVVAPVAEVAEEAAVEPVETSAD